MTGPKGWWDALTVRALHTKGGRNVLVLTAVIIALGIAAAKNGLPDVQPILMIVFAVVTGMNVLVLLMGRRPDKLGVDGVRRARIIRNGAAGVAGVLAAGVVMFSLGFGAVDPRLYPVIVIIAQLLLMVYLANRAAWFGAEPKRWTDLEERRAQAREARRVAEQEIRADDAPKVLLLPVEEGADDFEPDPQAASAAAARAAAHPVDVDLGPAADVGEPDDDLADVDLDGDDDLEDEVVEGVAVVDRHGKWHGLPTTEKG